MLQLSLVRFLLDENGAVRLALTTTLTSVGKCLHLPGMLARERRWGSSLKP